MGRNFARAIRRVTSSPSLNNKVVVIFLVTGLVEIADAVGQEIEGLSVGTRHGAVLFGLLHALKYFPELFEGLEYVEGQDGES